MSKDDRTIVGRAPNAGRNVHEQPTQILKRTAGPDAPTQRTKIDGAAAKAQKRKRAAAGHEEHKTLKLGVREDAAPRRPREPERAGPIAMGPPPPAPPRPRK
ncbi:MAG TPA: hypothetical protein VFF06_33305 [Polyangia bacterium]|nr:hypothetical protein [Polyangia bacterium]